MAVSDSRHSRGRPQLREMTVDECYRRLGEGDVGRVGVCVENAPAIIPVNYMLDAGSIVIRTAPYTMLADRATGPMAFEVDQLEPALKFGWSVLVVGQAQPVEDEDETVRLRSSGMLEPWASGTRNLFIRLSPQSVTGREIG